ncbi:unnamed protein product [Rangifer tarandus platyrhynchus]|uniref:Uncharacterized protein n=1 Tax=Rangifer tarandus platyrhynchus TaxID=3082113 RepID=A0AC60A710_RANTA
MESRLHKPPALLANLCRICGEQEQPPCEFSRQKVPCKRRTAEPDCFRLDGLREPAPLELRGQCLLSREDSLIRGAVVVRLTPDASGRVSGKPWDQEPELRLLEDCLGLASGGPGAACTSRSHANTSGSGGPSKCQHSSPVSNPGGYDSRQPDCQRQQWRKLLAIASLGFFSGL